MANLGGGDLNGGSGWGFVLAAGSAAVVAVVKAFIIAYYNVKKECNEHQNSGWGWGYFVATGIGAVLVGIAAFATVYFRDKNGCHQDPSSGSRFSEDTTDISTRKPSKVLKCGHTFHEKCVDPWLNNIPDCPICGVPQE